ncbi:hypothetical protein [Xanthocytophaga agilis]|uniref:Uncharacterized protein n=1 Tax=Xanthocytophaga agilis TaxID=3048010 RepID=A0AAE3R7W9_9BACT|nr:hypothetical protein [Xanthocytophaga agilis]MDJ1505311.1 hypothetical protein [Xanthocytophaga agilis]
MAGYSQFVYNSLRFFLGEQIGPSGNYFDPGKYGSYFILPLTLKLKQEAILRVKGDPLLAAFQERIQNYLQLLTEAQKSGSGMYITF